MRRSCLCTNRNLGALGFVILNAYMVSATVIMSCVFYFAQSESEVKNWVTEMNRQFDEVDKFELPVE